jgi:hypothetical protein
MSTGEDLVQSAKEAVTAPLPKPPALHKLLTLMSLKRV